ncbi:regucalcin-like [Contarinia nasturtii]|uniref:regucalcin-like n=1 Tax=Contarinia nasturtii TaxID=265458 RepID=UPI0012D3910B|nr:regucalcin-like [Contarinia nasturtii]
MSFKVEKVPSTRTIVGTRAHWDELTQSLYYNDVEGTIFRYDYKENKVYSATVDGEKVVGFIIPVANATKTSAKDEYALGLGRRVGIVHWDGVSNRALLGPIAFEVEGDKQNNRFNAAKACPLGRFYGGTMRSEKCGDIFQVAAGSLYKYIKGDGVYELTDGVFVSNGLAWDETTNKMYYIDTGKFDVKEYDWDRKTGDISNERVVIDFSDNGKNAGFLPDGLTIDTEGNLYITNFGGSNVVKVEPKTGKILMEIPIPAKQVSSITFGGPNLDILYVTTASSGDSDNELAGYLFKITGLGTKGFPGVRVRV